LSYKVKGTAFTEGGKALTSLEAGITFGHIPTGTEFSTVDFLAKLETTIQQTTNLIEDRSSMASRPRGQGLPPQPGLLRNTSKTGKPIVSRDGGKTWEYEAAGGDGWSIRPK
jgi:hypothetical protein